MARSSAEPRRTPRQARACATESAILDAAAHILEAEGEPGFNTNRVAETAGVSIGSLYQYFPNKQAILLALSRREVAAMRAHVHNDLAAAGDAVRTTIHRQIHAFSGRPTLRRAVVRAAIAEETAADLGAATDHIRALLPPIAGLTGLEAWTLSRAIIGAIRAAVLENHPRLYDPAFEDALVLLVEGARRTASVRSEPTQLGGRE